MLTRLCRITKHRLVFVALTLSLPAICSAAPLTPSLTSSEQATYQIMMKGQTSEAKVYRTSREYLSLCRQVIADPSQAIGLPAVPGPTWRSYLTPDERETVYQALDLSIKALSNAP